MLLVAVAAASRVRSREEDDALYGCVIVHTVDGRTFMVDTRWVIPGDICMLYVYRQLANAPLRM